MVTLTLAPGGGLYGFGSDVRAPSPVTYVTCGAQ